MTTRTRGVKMAKKWLRKNDASERVERKRSNAGKYRAKPSVKKFTRRTASAYKASLSVLQIPPSKGPNREEIVSRGVHLK